MASCVDMPLTNEDAGHEFQHELDDQMYTQHSQQPCAAHTEIHTIPSSPLLFPCSSWIKTNVGLSIHTGRTLSLAVQTYTHSLCS